jgi:hypothetical protein
MDVSGGPAPRQREWTDDDDALLSSIVALRTLWNGHGGRVTVAELGLEARLVTLVVSGVCPRHGQFVAEWTGRVADRPPLEARCPAGGGTRCAEISPVFVLV